MSPAEIDLLIDRIVEGVATRLESRPKLIDRYALAKSIGLSVPTIERLQAAGKIPVIRAGRRCLYDPTAVVSALSENEKGGAA